MKTEILHTFTNNEDGVAAEVARVEGGFSVVLRDLDADSVVPSARVFPREDAAVAYAKGLI